MLAGCATTSTQMVNANGQVVNCGAWGFGIIGAPVALISTHECVKKHEELGFHEVGGQQAAAPPSANSPTKLTGRDGSFTLDLQPGWVLGPPPSQPFQFHVRNQALDSYLMVSAISLKDIQDWVAYSESLRKRLQDNLTQATSSESQRIMINGREAWRAEVGGFTKSGVRVRYLGTAIKTDQNIIYLLSWCLDSRFDTNRVALEQVALGLAP